MKRLQDSKCNHELDETLRMMIALASAQPRQTIPWQQIEIWAGSLRNHRFFNLIGLLLAERYAEEIVSYQVCDFIMNDLWRAWLEGVEDGMHVPMPFYEIDEAFDAGEYHRQTDKRDYPVSNFTVD